MEILRAQTLRSCKAPGAGHDERAEDRKSQVGSGDRSERIRTYNFPQGRVTDHRINLTLYKLDRVIEGDMDELIDALVSDHQSRLLAEQAGTWLTTIRRTTIGAALKQCAHGARACGYCQRLGCRSTLSDDNATEVRALAEWAFGTANACSNW